MRSSVLAVTLQQCCARTLRDMTQKLIRAGVRRNVLARPPLARILSTDTSYHRTITLEDWRALAGVAGELSKKAKAKCGRAAGLEVLRHGDKVGVFWRSFADCFR